MPNQFSISDSVRPMHIYMPGKTRYGKSTLLFWMALQDIARGNGVCVMDAKGDLVKMLIDWIPKNRVEDTLYLDIDTPVPLDFMAYQNEREKEALIGELKFLLMRTVEPQHAPLMNANLTDVIYTLLNCNENPNTPPSRKTTFLDLYYFLEYKDRREEILSHVADPNLIRRWNNNFPNPVEASRITSRMTPFVRSESLRKIFGAPDPKLNIVRAMQERKVILVDLGPADDTQKTYGTLLISKIRQAAYRRVSLPQSQRVPYYLYCDEFQKFQTSDFDEMLSMAGGFGLCLTLAHQFTDQLEPRILQSVLGNVSTFIIFRVGQQSANCLRGEVPKDYLQYLPTLGKGVVLYRAANGSVKWVHTPKPPDFTRASYAEIIRKRTVDGYGCDASQVCSTERDGNRNAAPPEEITPTGPPRVPSHGGKKKDARTSR